MALAENETVAQRARSGCAGSSFSTAKNSVVRMSVTEKSPPMWPRRARPIISTTLRRMSADCSLRRRERSTASVVSAKAGRRPAACSYVIGERAKTLSIGKTRFRRAEDGRPKPFQKNGPVLHPATALWFRPRGSRSAREEAR